MRDLKLRLILSLPSIAYMAWCIYFFITSWIPLASTTASNFFQLTIGEIILLIFGITLFPFTFALAIIWLGVVWSL